jgi:hypothetical protein
MPRKNDPYDKQWIRLKNRYRKYNPVCEVVGCFEASAQVDHILTVKARPDLRLSWNNLQALCHSHHAALTRAYDDGRLDGACDADGNSLDPNHPWNLSTADGIAVANNHRKADPALKAKMKRQYVTGFRR